MTTPSIDSVKRHKSAIQRRRFWYARCLKFFVACGAMFWQPISAIAEQESNDAAAQSCWADTQATKAAALCYAIGDQLKITFYEQMVSGADIDKTTAAASQYPDLVERLELTGTYVVQADGRIYLPLIGAVKIASQSDAAAQALLTKAFQSATHHTGKISIVVAERESVYVVGAVTQPGAVKYLPGMTTLHALALSGGVDGAKPEYSRTADAMRERERRDRSIGHLKRLLAHRLALIAERDGQATAKADDRLLKFADQLEAEKLVADDVNERHLLATSRDLQRKILEQTISATNDDLARARQRMARLDASMKNRQDRFDSLNTAESRGTLTPFSLTQARTELMDVQERQEEVKSSVAQFEQKLVQAKNDQAKIDLDAQVELARDLKTVENDIAEEESTVEASTRLIGAAINAPNSAASNPLKARFEIVRREPDDVQRFAATEDTRLRPGDLLEIIPLIVTGAIP